MGHKSSIRGARHEELPLAIKNMWQALQTFPAEDVNSYIDFLYIPANADNNFVFPKSISPNFRISADCLIFVLSTYQLNLRIQSYQEVATILKSQKSIEILHRTIARLRAIGMQSECENQYVKC